MVNKAINENIALDKCQMVYNAKYRYFYIIYHCYSKQITAEVTKREKNTDLVLNKGRIWFKIPQSNSDFVTVTYILTEEVQY